MAEFPAHDRTLGSGPARNLANTTKTPPQWRGVTPRWLVSLLPWTPVEAGTYRVNRVKEAGESEIAIACSPGDNDELPAAYIDYEDPPSSTRSARSPRRSRCRPASPTCFAARWIRCANSWPCSST